MSKPAGEKRPGLLVVVSGPSGVGKTTVVERLIETTDYERALTATTRKPRPGEVDGVDYHFLGEREFEERVDRGEFLEHAVVHGRHYGTPASSVTAVTGRGGVCILNVDVQGGAAVRTRRPRALLVFILPPSFSELERRLRGRGTEDPDVVARRLENARVEMTRSEEYDFRVVNDDLDRAVEELRSLVEERTGEATP